MLRVRLRTAEAAAEIYIDPRFIGYDRDRIDGVDLLCGHCENIMFPAFSTTNNSRSIRIAGLRCTSCGGGNILDTDAIQSQA